MTTSIRTRWTEHALRDSISYGYAEWVDPKDQDDILKEIFRLCVDYVNGKLPTGAKWFPYISEVYVNLDAEDDSVEDIDALISDLTDEFFAALNDAFDGNDAPLGLDALNAFAETL